MEENTNINTTEQVNEAPINPVVETMINNGVTKEELKEILGDFLRPAPQPVDVDAAMNDYFSSFVTKKEN